MKIGPLEIIYVVIFFQLLVFSISLFFKKKKDISLYILGFQLIAQAAGAFNDVVTGFQLEFFYNNNPHLILLGYPFYFLWGPTFYLYVASVSYKDFRLKAAHILHFIPFISATLFLSITLYPFSFEEKKTILSTGSFLTNFSKNFSLYIDIFIKLQVLFYIVLSVLILHSIRRKLKDDFSSLPGTNFSWIQFLVAGFAISYVLSVPMQMISAYGLKNPNFLVDLAVIVPYFIYFNIIYFKAWNQPEIFIRIEEKPKYKSSKLTKEEAAVLVKKLNNYISAEKPYLNPDLTLNQLAEDLDINSRILSQIINEYFHQNFYDFINRLRVEESKEMLIDSSCNKNILEILYEVGFNNKSAYYNAFKRATGLTPKEFKNRSIKEPVSFD